MADETEAACTDCRALVLSRIEGEIPHMDTAQFLKDLRAERDRINNAISALEALNGSGVTQLSAKTATSVERTLD